MNYTKEYGTYRKFAEFLDFVWGKPGWHNLTWVMNRLLDESAELATAAGIRELWRRRLPSARKKRVDLYLAMPYCRRRCAYCMYYSKPLNRPADLAEYVKKLCASISYYSGVLDRIRFHAVYFGGGTPSLLTESQLERLAESFKRHIHLRGGCERTVECNPESLTAGKLKIFRRMGFNRLSLGVQSLDGALLRSVNRGEQTPAMVERAIRAGKENGFYVNVDLISGLAGDDGRATFNSIMWTAARGPDKITVCRLSPTGHYMAAPGRGVTGLKLAENRPGKWLLSAEKDCRALGYVHESGGLGSAHETTSLALVKTPADWKFGYNVSSASRGKAIFGLGHQASSYFFDKLRYCSRELGTDPGADEYSVYPYSRKDKMRAFILEGFDSKNHLDLRKFKSVFKTEPGAAFKNELAALKALGKIKYRKDYPVFLAKDPLDRIASSFFLMDPVRLRRAIQKLASRHSGATGTSPAKTRS